VRESMSNLKRRSCSIPHLFFWYTHNNKMNLMFEIRNRKKCFGRIEKTNFDDLKCFAFQRKET
jgi:hypothetical protein